MITGTLIYLAIGGALSLYQRPAPALEHAICVGFWPLLLVSLGVVWINEFRHQPE